MRHNKFDKKIRFSYLLPFGFISPMALELDVNYPADAYCDYRPDKSMDERIADCHRAHKRRMEAINAMQKYGYIEEVSIKYGNSHWEETRMFRLTRAGFYWLTNTPDQETEAQRLEKSYKPGQRNLSKNTYLDMSAGAVLAREELYTQAKRKEESQEEAELFRTLFAEAIEEYGLTILASEPYLAKQTQIPSRLRNHQQYRFLRIANVEALFKANRFLTSLDRRPLQFGHSPVVSEQLSAQQDIYAFTQNVLDKWYQQHPHSYIFNDPSEDNTEQRKLAWEETPAFYGIHEIPGFEGTVSETSGMQLRGANTLIRHSFVGLAVGRKTSYIVYHTRPTKTPWSETIERATALAVSKAVETSLCEAQNTAENDAEKNTEINPNKVIKNALMICPTVHQFASLFTLAKEHMPRRWAKEKRVGRPYQSICIIPLNHSGSMQLRCLMLSTPTSYEAILASNFLTQPGFTERPLGKEERDNIYKLSYNKRPVLLAHTMDFQKLFWAMEDYLEGKKFYVACYPEQAKYIRMIMPDVEFL